MPARAERRGFEHTIARHVVPQGVLFRDERADLLGRVLARHTPRDPPRELGLGDCDRIEPRLQPVALDCVRRDEIRQHLLVVRSEIAERRRGARKVKRRPRGRRPRVAILFVEQRHQIGEESDVALVVVRLPHVELEVGRPIRIEDAQ